MDSKFILAKNISGKVCIICFIVKYLVKSKLWEMSKPLWQIISFTLLDVIELGQVLIIVIIIYYFAENPPCNFCK